MVELMPLVLRIVLKKEGFQVKCLHLQCSLVTSLYQSCTKLQISYVCSLDAGPPSPANHLREVFYRMGLDDKVITV